MNLILCPHIIYSIFHNHEFHPHSSMAILLSLPSPPPKPPQNPNPKTSKPISLITPRPTPLSDKPTTKRDFILTTTSLCFLSLTFQYPLAHSSAEPSSPPKPSPLGVANTKSWFRFYGDGFAIRVPPEFEDVMEPEVCILFFLLKC